jgi:hypothetical protein
LTAKVVALNIKAGIQRDGTQFDSPVYIDGEWVRFQRGRPRKVGGYKGIFLNGTGVSRGMIQSSLTGLNYVYSGYSSGAQWWQTDDDDGVGSGPTAISLSDFTSNANNLWQWDIAYDGGGTNALTVMGHPGQNLTHIDSTVNTPVLIGNFPGGAMAAVKDSAGAHASGANISVSGGCCMLYPYLFVYGNNGLIKNSSAGNFAAWNNTDYPDANENNVSATKIVKGMPLRGGTTSPAGLFWSLDALVRVTYAPQTVGAATLYWRYDLISSQSSIMSSQCVVEYDGIYYWIGIDRFLAYNGVVQEVPNQMNMNWFFDNLNYSQRQKVWATKVPRWGEIWWFYPRGDATECTDAIIYNVREQTWYDAGSAVGARRSAGTFSEVFRFPIWAGWEQNTENKYTIWQHEVGTDQIYLNSVDAVLSQFETNSLGWVSGGPGVRQIENTNRWMRLERIEPDFVQSGDMNVYITGKSYAQDTTETTTKYTFAPDTPKIDMREQRREMRIRFESNVAGGNYETGQILLSADIGDERGTANP